jgi:hypothetical protein
MSLAKKGTRVVDVDGRRYRWRVHTAGDPNFAIVVELAEHAAQRMVTWVHPPAYVITPDVVRGAIRHALAHGWAPDRRGPELTFRFDSTTGS